MNRIKHTCWFSNGNLIVSGEYFVLTGAKALAVPLRFGQMMEVDRLEKNNSTIHWVTKELGKEWFKADLESENLNILSASDMNLAGRLQKILKEIIKMRPLQFAGGRSYNILCNIGFNLKWGWGSSATLISNLANWAGIDPFELNKRVSSGSGYDIAASLSPSPVFYRLNQGMPEVEPVAFNPAFKDSIYFIYLGKKQNTAASIEKNIDSVLKNKNLIPVISSLSEKIAKEENMTEFMRNISEHEKILSSTLRHMRIREKYFNNFEGEIKSLGAWGGDFAMAVSPLTETSVKEYFKNKGLVTVFRFDEIIKTDLPITA